MRTRLRADPHAPRLARRIVRDELAGADLPARVHVEDAALVASELVTNSVRAGAATIDIDVRASEGRVDLLVADDAPGWPTPRNAAADDLDGRGLAIVDELAHRWTTSPGNPGKSVTATWFRKR